MQRCDALQPGEQLVGKLIQGLVPFKIPPPLPEEPELHRRPGWRCRHQGGDTIFDLDHRLTGSVRLHTFVAVEQAFDLGVERVPLGV